MNHSRAANNMQDNPLVSTLEALKATVRDLKLSLQQANELVEVKLNKELGDENVAKLFQLIVTHIDQRDPARSDQYKAVINTALITLNQVAQQTTDLEAKQRLVEVIKALTIMVQP